MKDKIRNTLIINSLMHSGIIAHFYAGAAIKLPALIGNKMVVIQPVIFPVNCKIRYIKLTAINQGTCPEWHSGTGNKYWMFVDEIVLE